MGDILDFSFLFCAIVTVRFQMFKVLILASRVLIS